MSVRDARNVLVPQRGGCALPRCGSDSFSGRAGRVLATLDFPRGVTGEPGTLGAFTMTNVCAHTVSTFPKEDFVLVGHHRHHGRSMKAKKNYSGWWCANCGRLCEWRRYNCIVVMQIGNSEDDQKIFRAQSLPKGEVDNVTAALSFFQTRRIKKYSSVFKSCPRGPQRDSLGAGHQCRQRHSDHVQAHTVVRKVVLSNIQGCPAANK